MGLDALTMHNM